MLEFAGVRVHLIRPTEDRRSQRSAAEAESAPHDNSTLQPSLQDRQVKASCAVNPYRTAPKCFLKQNLMVSADCEPTSSLRASQSDFPNGRWCIMSEEFASYSFLAVTVASLVLLCSGLLAMAFA
jgi:hypothetical protein